MTRVYHICVMCRVFYFTAVVVAQSMQNISFCVAHRVITLLEWTCNSHKLCQKPIRRSATVITSVWQLCFLCISKSPPPLVWVLPKNKIKEKKVLYQSNVKVPLCVWLCCKTHHTVLCQWLPLQHSEPASFTACDQNTHSGPLGFSHI